ncbi:hypothetical protein HYW31_00895, partial [Candidatus Berkelbacteria bacterium]|nr:hypothetical protein [Candidatus Berkelbacteria bacterium]
MRGSGITVMMVGVGRVYEEYFETALGIWGENRQILLDIDPQRIAAVSPESPVLSDDRYLPAEISNLSAGERLKIVADAQDLPFSFQEWPEGERLGLVGIVATPNHLEVMHSLARAGFLKLIVEKPLVNNLREVEELKDLLEINPSLKIYPLDFYVQKIAPLLVLTGKITPDDPRWDWVVMGNGERVLPEICGTLEERIGKIEGVQATIFEGGKLGLPDLAERTWLEQDKKRGGMLLDLGTHALAPLGAAGLFSAEQTKVECAYGHVFNQDRSSYRSSRPYEAEMHAQALLTLKRDQKDIPLILEVGKTFHAGGMWHLVIRGEQGNVFMGLRTGDSLVLVPKKRGEELLHLSLREG